MLTCFMKIDREKKNTTVFLTKPEDVNEWGSLAPFPEVLDTVPKDHTVNIVYDSSTKRVFTSS